PPRRPGRMSAQVPCSSAVALLVVTVMPFSVKLAQEPAEMVPSTSMRLSCPTRSTFSSDAVDPVMVTTIRICSPLPTPVIVIRALTPVPLNCSWTSPLGTLRSSKRPAVSTVLLMLVPTIDTVLAAYELLPVPLIIAVPAAGGVEIDGEFGVVERSDPHAATDSAQTSIVTIANRLD